MTGGLVGAPVLCAMQCGHKEREKFKASPPIYTLRGNSPFHNKEQLQNLRLCSQGMLGEVLLRIMFVSTEKILF